MRVGGVPFRLCLELAAEPGKNFYTWEIAEKYGLDQTSVSTRLRPAVETGYLVRKRVQGASNVRYEAGPRLLKEIGK